LSSVPQDADGEQLHVSGEFRKSRSLKVARHFYDFPALWPEIASLSALALANALSGPFQWVMVGLGIVGGVLSLVIRSRGAKRLSDVERQRDDKSKCLETQRQSMEAEQISLQTDNENLTVQVKALQSSLTDMLDHNLRAFAQEFSFDNTERISVYLHRRSSQVFEGKARHCKDLRLDVFRRDIYKDDEGCIGKALSQGKYVVKGLPDPIEDAEAWNAEQYRQTGLDTSIASKIRLQARDIGAFAIENGHRIGVVVVESSRTGVLDFDQIEKAIERESNHLAEVLQLILDHTEESRAAAQEGF
jgi:hypothetical protein